MLPPLFPNIPVGLFATKHNRDRIVLYGLVRRKERLVSILDQL